MGILLRSKFALLVCLLAVALPLTAEEGMWMPQQIPKLVAQLKAMGFEGDSDAFADLTGHPMGAIVSLGGCTASFVSPDGLIVTNHHCATGALQYNSKPDANLLENGYLARTRDEELWNGPGYKVSVTVSVKEVTDAITGNISPKLDDRKRFALIDRRIKQQTAECEKTGLRCRVASFFEGMRYFEIGQMEISDVRTVYAPADGIGNFGGETDNWRWPRHTGDWSFFRAYVGKDGKPAAYSKDNVPYQPKHWLKVSAAGVKPSDLVLVVGYPGRTERHQTYAEVKETADWSFPRTIRINEEQIKILEDLAKTDKALAIKTAGRLQGLNNTLTNRRGMLEGLRGGILAAKEARQKSLIEWIAADSQKEYGDVLPALDALQAEAQKTRERDAVMRSLLPTIARTPSLLSSAHVAYLLSLEKPKKDIEREAGFQERDWSRMRENQERMQRSLDVRIDRALLRYALGQASELPADQRIPPLDKAIGLQPGMSKPDALKAIDAFLDPLYAGTKLADQAFRLSLLDMKTAQIVASKDPMVELAVALDSLDRSLREEDKRRRGAESRLRPRLMKALLAQGGGLVAPDANGTLRVTFGQVKGVDSKDGIFYKPFTTLAGIEQKHTGQGDFIVPGKELAAIKSLRSGKRSPFVDEALGDVPVDFLSTVDTTGGNSGSPALNRRGELVGLLFDGTYDTIASDYLYDRVRTRSINVEVRYLLWTMAEVDGASHLLQEMGVR